MPYSPAFMVGGDNPVQLVYTSVYDNQVYTLAAANAGLHPTPPLDASGSLSSVYGMACDNSGNVIVTGVSASGPTSFLSTNGGHTWTNIRDASGNNRFSAGQGYSVFVCNRFRDLSGTVFIIVGDDSNNNPNYSIWYGTPSSPIFKTYNFTLFNITNKRGYIRGIATNGTGLFVVVGLDQNGKNIASSTDYGNTWTATTSSQFNSMGNAVAYGRFDNTAVYGFVAVGDTKSTASTIYTSSDASGLTWTGRGNPFGTGSNDKAFAVASDPSGNWLVGGSRSGGSGANSLSFSIDAITFSAPLAGGPTTHAYGVYKNPFYTSGGSTPYWLAVGNDGGGVPSIYYNLRQDASGATWIAASGSYANPSRVVTIGYVDLVCFAKGTKISTPIGYIPVEDLHEGDVILINKGEYANIRKIFHRTVKVTPITAPYRIPGGEGHEDLTISPTHSVFVRGQMIEAQFLGYPHDDRYTDLIEYYNISVDGDENTVMYANGVPIETYRERNTI